LREVYFIILLNFLSLVVLLLDVISVGSLLIGLENVGRRMDLCLILFVMGSLFDGILCFGLEL
jgi:hypothetical protein